MLKWLTLGSQGVSRLSDVLLGLHTGREPCPHTLCKAHNVEEGHHQRHPGQLPGGAQRHGEPLAFGCQLPAESLIPSDLYEAMIQSIRQLVLGSEQAILK